MLRDGQAIRNRGEAIARRGNLDVEDDQATVCHVEIARTSEQFGARTTKAIPRS